MTPPRETPPAPSVGEIAELLEQTAEYFDLRNGHNDQAREAFDAAASHLRAVADVLAELPRRRPDHDDDRTARIIYQSDCVAFVDRLRTALSDHQGNPSSPHLPERLDERK